MSCTRVLPSVLAAALILSFSGCRDKEVTHYRVKKEAAAPAPASASTTSVPNSPAAPAPAAPSNSGPARDMASTPVTTAQGTGLSWTAPSHWTVKAASAMRRGSYAITGANGAAADLAITAFPGNVGGNLANVNRWRNQLGLGPIGEAEMEASLSHHDFNGLHMDVVDIQGAPGSDRQRTLGAIVPFGDATWFFKLSGPDALVAGEKQAFMSFLQTVKPPKS